MPKFLITRFYKREKKTHKNVGSNLSKCCSLVNKFQMHFFMRNFYTQTSESNQIIHRRVGTYTRWKDMMCDDK